MTAPTYDRNDIAAAVARGSRLRARIHGPTRPSSPVEPPSCPVAGATVAAIDIGSTSVHLLVACWTDGILVPLADDSVFFGLGRTVDATGEVGSARASELAAVIERQVRIARELGAQAVGVVGTEPLRRAGDLRACVGMVERAVGTTVDVLDHSTEGFLTLVGVTGGSRQARDLAVVDVGGGSSELVIARVGEWPAARGMRLGTARLTHAVQPGDPPSWADLVAMRAIAREGVSEAPRLAPIELVAVGGTASNLLKLAPLRRRRRCLDRQDLEQIIRRLVARTSGRVARRYGVSRSRAKLLPAGATILAMLLEQAGLDSLNVSHAGIREGLAIVLARHGQPWRERLPSLLAEIAAPPDVAR